MAFKKKEYKKIDFSDDDEEEYEEAEEESEEEQPKVKQPQQVVKKEKTVPPLPNTWEVKEVPVEVQRVIHNNKTGESYDLYNAIVLILNRTEE